MNTHETLEPSSEGTKNEADTRSSRASAGAAEDVRGRIVIEEERFSKTKLALQVFQTVGILLVAVSLYFSWRTLKAEQKSMIAQHEWNRRQYTAQVLGRWDEAIKDHRNPIVEAFPGLVQDAYADIPSQDRCRRIREAKKGEFKVNGVDAFELRAHIISVFDYFEDLAIAWDTQTGNQKTIEESVAGAILRWHDFFRYFIQDMKQEMKYDSWPALTRTVEIWKADRAQKTMPMPKAEEGEE